MSNNRKKITKTCAGCNREYKTPYQGLCWDCYRKKPCAAKPLNRISPEQSSLIRSLFDIGMKPKEISVKLGINIDRVRYHANIEYNRKKAKKSYSKESIAAHSFKSMLKNFINRTESKLDNLLSQKTYSNKNLRSYECLRLRLLELYELWKSELIIPSAISQIQKNIDIAKTKYPDSKTLITRKINKMEDLILSHPNHCVCRLCNPIFNKNKEATKK